MKQVHNFSAGPGILPPAVLRQAQEDLLNFEGQGMSIMEMSHRSKTFVQVIEKAEADLRSLMEIPSHYRVLFLQGGAHSQFSMVPLNLMGEGEKAVYLDTGIWSQKAIREARKFGQVEVLASGEASGYRAIPSLKEAKVDPSAAYFHLTTNNTIYGTQVQAWPDTSIPVVADMSSNILARKYRVEDFGVIYAGAQKNMGPAGMTLVIIREDLLPARRTPLPLMMDYALHAEKKSLFNTPPTFAIYMAGLVYAWTLQEGGVATMEKRNQAKAELLYRFLDQSTFFEGRCEAGARSLMNVCFQTPAPETDTRFIAAAESAGFANLKGHRLVGGMRASLYNPMPMSSVEALVSFMEEFEKSAS
ncbi:MAG: 3-phosphoserine/phosphohydroxythreonine transaminase [Bacteroidota bacterium]